MTKKAYSPWGQADHTDPIARGLAWVSTPGHGGVRVSRGRQEKIPIYMQGYAIRTGDYFWYEEDIDWCIPALIFPAEFWAHKLRQCHAQHTNAEETIARLRQLEEEAKSTLLNWRPGSYELFFDVEIQPGESRERDEEVFRASTQDEFVTICASGDWKEGVPKGMVEVVARKASSREERVFLVPHDEYTAPRPHTFVVDETRHQERNMT